MIRAALGRVQQVGCGGVVSGVYRVERDGEQHVVYLAMDPPDGDRSSEDFWYGNPSQLIDDIRWRLRDLPPRQQFDILAELARLVVEAEARLLESEAEGEA